MENMKIILEALVGSRAYGLETNSSDEDILGVYVAPLSKVFGLFKPQDTVHSTSSSTSTTFMSSSSVPKTGPDFTYHEVEKFIKLCLKCNPTILELLFLNDYRILTTEGELLLANRNIFLSKKIYKSYGAYAIDQARRLNARGDSFPSDVKNRYSKHARHCFRLLEQGKQLLETGTLDIKVKDRDDLFKIGELPVSDLVERFEQEYKEFDKIKTKLPDEPNHEKANELLLTIRRMND